MYLHVLISAKLWLKCTYMTQKWDKLAKNYLNLVNFQGQNEIFSKICYVECAEEFLAFVFIQHRNLMKVKKIYIFI